MSKIMFIIYFFMWFLVVSSMSYAKTYTVEVNVNCSPSVELAGWKFLNSHPKRQLTLTTEGMYIKGEGLVKLWDDDDEANDYENPVFHSQTVGDMAVVVAGCVSSGGEMQMYSYDQGTNPPVLVCPKGDGIKMRFITPNNPDPEQYVYHATLTVVEDDEPLEKATIEIKTQESSKDPVSKFDVKGQQTFTSSKSMGKSSGGEKPSKCIIMSGEPDYCMYNSLLKLVSLSSFISP